MPDKATDALIAAMAKFHAAIAEMKDAREELHVAIKAMFAAYPDFPVAQVAVIARYSAEHVRRVRDGREPSRPTPIRQRRVTRQDGGAPAPSA